MPAARRLLFTLLVCLVVPLLRAARPFGAEGETHVHASLVAADQSIQPGHDVWVALRLAHDEHWHTYWVNPGTGLATTLKWALPPGWKASDIQWPAPHLLKDQTGAIIGQGYDGDILLPVRLTAPADLAPGHPVTLKATADWLMCAEVCVPGGSDVSITLPVAADPAKPDAQWGEPVRSTIAALPRPDEHWQVSATRTGKTLLLAVAPVGSVSHLPKDLWFFSSDGLVAYDQPQAVKSDRHGGFTLTLTTAPEAAADAKRLAGVLVSENGWLADASLRGLAVDTPLTNGPVAAVAGTNGGAPEEEKRGLLGTLLLGVLGGLILNLMPCVFPVIGIKIIGFVNQAGHERRRVVMHGLTFVLGVLLSFWVLAGVLTALRAGGSQLGWGFQLQSPVFVYALAILMLVFGLNMSGVFEFGLRATAIGSDLQMKSGYGGSFFSGVLATVVATPCSAPILAPVLGVALAVPVLQSFAIFTSIAVGLSLPYLLLSMFPQAVKALPRPGAWMETFKQFMAFLLYGTTAYLTWVLVAETSEEGLRSVLFSFVIIALAIWMYGRWHAPGASARSARFAVISLIVVGAVGLWIGWPRSIAAETTPQANAAPEVVWAPWSPQAVEKLRGEGRIVYVDFTARWCFTCQTNKQLVFHNDEVLRYFADHKIATLRADWTNRDPRITAALAGYGRSAVPFNLIWLPGKDQPVILPEVLTASTVLDALKKG